MDKNWKKKKFENLYVKHKSRLRNRESKKENNNNTKEHWFQNGIIRKINKPIDQIEIIFFFEQTFFSAFQ